MKLSTSDFIPQLSLSSTLGRGAGVLYVPTYKETCFRMCGKQNLRSACTYMQYDMSFTVHCVEALKDNPKKKYPSYWSDIYDISWRNQKVNQDFSCFISELVGGFLTTWCVCQSFGNILNNLNLDHFE